MMNRLRSGGGCWQKRVWLAVMLLFGAVCPGWVHAQFQRLWETRTNLLFNGQFHRDNYYAPALSNYNRTITLYRLSPAGTLVPLWSYTEPTAGGAGLYPVDIDSGAERIFLRVARYLRTDLWALGMDGSFRWVIHSDPSSYYYVWLKGDGGGGVYEQLESRQDWRTVLNWYTPNNGALGWSYSRAGFFVATKDPQNRLLIMLPIVSNNRRVGIRFEWYIMPGNLVRVMEWRLSEASVEYSGPFLFDAMGNFYLVVVVFSGSWDTYLLSISPEGQIRWLQRVPAPPFLSYSSYSRGFYYSPSDHSLLLFRRRYGATQQVEMDKLSAYTGEIIRSRVIYQTAREEINAVLVALDERFLYMAVNEGHMERDCGYEGCNDYFVLDEVVLLRFDLNGELRAHMRFSDSEYVSRIESVQGNLWLFHSSLGTGGAISCYKPLAVRADGDIDGNGCVDETDLLQLLFAFGQTGTDLPEDINQDGVVDDADLMRVLFAFGFGC